MSLPTPPPAPAASGLSALFSLSQAAASAPPIAMPVSADHQVSKDVSHHPVPSTVGGKSTHAMKHRRLSSTGQMRRRMSDAREAANRPSLVHSAATALASMSIAPAPSASPVQSHMHTRSRSQAHADVTGVNAFVVNLKPAPVPITARRLASGALAKSMPTQDLDLGSAIDDDIEVDVEEDDNLSISGAAKEAGPPAKIGKNTGKKRGTIFKCESCSKIYRHPSCLIKHRWEHSPHWREAAKFMLSKHQQVQLLEAATILSHLDTSSSLPEDRSLWPSYLSGGALPPPSTATPSLVNANGTNSSASKPEAAMASLVAPSHAFSSSMPTRPSSLSSRTRSGSVSTTVSLSTSPGGGVPGPRMHDFAIPLGGNSGITQIRPGLLGVAAPPFVNTLSSSVSISLPVVPYAEEEDNDQDAEEDHEQSYDDVPRSGISVSSPEKPRPMAVPLAHQSSSGGGYGAYRDAKRSGGFSFGSSISPSVSASGGGWSMPSSDIRSGSVARSYSETGSRDGSRSEDEVLVSDDEAEMISNDDGYVSIAGSGSRSTGSESSPSRYDDGFANGKYSAYNFAGRSGWKKDTDRYTPSERGLYVVSDKLEDPVAAQDQEWVGMDMDMDL